MPYGILNLVLPLFTFFSSFFLGAWTLYLAPRERLNRVFVLFVAVVALWSIADVGIRVSPTTDTAMMWSRLAGSGWIFMVPTFLHFVLILTKREQVLGNKLSYLALYGPAIIFLGMAWLTEIFYSGITFQTQVGYMPTIGNGGLAAIVYTAVSFLLSMYYIFKTCRESTGLEKTQMGMVGASLLAPVLGSIMIFVLLPLMGIETYGVASMAIFPPMMIVLAIAIVKYKLFVLPPVSRFLIPLPEAEFRTKPKFKLKKGRSYLIKKKKFSQSLAVFMDQIKHGVFGLWITSLRPGQAERYGVRRTPVLYLATERSRGEVTLPLSKLDKAIALVSNYILNIRGRRSVVFVDCFEELVAVNGFGRAMDFLKKMAEFCSKNNSNLIVQVDPSKLKKERLATIEKVIAPYSEKIKS